MTHCSHCQTPVPDSGRYCRACGADLSDTGGSARSRAQVKALFEELTSAVGGRYQVLDLLGRGGMGAVFLAEDIRLGRRVAIKVLLPEFANDDKFVGRFEREARIAAGLDHPAIIPIYAVEQAAGVNYFVMKYVPGQSLDELLLGKPLPLELAQRILLAAGSGLAHAHQRGVIHRDVKPANIMVTADGQAIVTDFGISKALEGATQLTSTGQMLGTPQYMSPEQAEGSKVDARSDQYSLGIVGYQMLVGHPPFTAETVHALLYKHRYETPTPPHRLRLEIAPHVSEAIERAIAKSQEHRFPSMEAFVAAIAGEAGGGSVIADTVQVNRDGPAGRGAARRFPVAAALGAGGTLALIALAVALRARSGKPPGPDASGTALPAPAPIIRAPPAPPLADSTTPSSATRSSVQPDTARPVSDAATPRQTPVTTSQPRLAFPKPAAPRAPRPARADSALAPIGSGYLTINAVPYGTVSINGVEIGDTPIVRHELPAGRYVVQIARDGYRTRTDTIAVTAGNEVRFSRPLIRDSQ